MKAGFNKLMLGIILLISLTSLVQAQPINERENVANKQEANDFFRNKFLQDIKDLIEEAKEYNKGKLNLAKVESAFYEELADFKKSGKITSAQEAVLKSGYEKLLAQIEEKKAANETVDQEEMFSSMMDSLTKDMKFPMADEIAKNRLEANATKVQSDKDAAFSSLLTKDDKDSVFKNKGINKENDTKFKEYKKSDFMTCMIDFKSDYYIFMMSKKISENSPVSSSMFDYQTSLLAFEYMTTGAENYDDYWIGGDGAQKGSIHKRLKGVALESQKLRRDVEKKLLQYNKKLTCLCLDTLGAESLGLKADVDLIANYRLDVLDGKKPIAPKLSTNAIKIFCGGEPIDQEMCKAYNLSSETTPEFKQYKDSLLANVKDKAVYYANYCEDERKNFASMIRDIDIQNNNTDLKSDTAGDASGVKSARMLVYFTESLKDFTMELTVDYTKIYTAFSEINKWYQIQNAEDKWGQARMDTKYLFDFIVLDNPKHEIYRLAAAAIAMLLTAGMIAVISGNFTSVLSTWAAIGIIGSGAIGAGGVHLVSTLRGAWISKAPFIEDSKKNTFDCGTKKDPKSCTNYTRMIKYPVSDICQANISSNACIKHFLVSKDENGQDVYLVDPWIPYGIKKSEIITDSQTLVSRLQSGFQQGINLLPSGPTGTLNAPLSESYRMQNYFTTEVAGYFAPKLLPDLSQYEIKETAIKLIKDKAIEYAVNEKFFEESEKEQLEIFANYVYENHFVWPKSSQKDIVAYPIPSFLTYLDLMSVGVTGTLTTDLAKNSNQLRALNTKYLENYKKILNNYKGVAIGASKPSAISFINKELANIDKKLAENKMLESELRPKVGEIGLSKNSIGLNDVSSQATSMQGGQVSSFGALGALPSRFATSVKSLRTARLEQIKKLDEFNANVGSKDTDRARSLLKGQLSKVSSFTSPTNRNNLSTLGSSMFNNSSDSSKNKKGEDSNGKQNESNGGLGGFNFGAVGSGVDLYGSKTRSSSRDSDNGSYDSSGGSGSGSSSAETNKQIESAISAREREESKYDSDSGDTLWERITKTYIRNYDKVLDKRVKGNSLDETKK